MRRGPIGVLLAGLAFALVVASAAGQAPQSYSLPSADIDIDVQRDGSLGTEERLEVAFSGEFHFGYRDIPLRRGESLSAPAVAEDGSAYRKVSRTDLSPGEPGTFGVKRTEDGVRIVWYFDARDETRAFTISYTLRGVAVAYDDVVDVNLKVWGDQWAEPLGRLVAVETAPGKIARAWGKPASARGRVEIRGSRATLRATRIPANQHVELRTLIARSAFTSAAAMRVERGLGLPAILAEERAQAADVKPVIGKPITMPKRASAGKRFTVSFRVTRSDNGKPMTSGRMIAHPYVRGTVIWHSESFRRGTARLAFVVPADAAGTVLNVKVTIEAQGGTATRVASFRIQRLPLPKLSIANAAIPEGSVGTTTISFPVTLSAAAEQKVTVAYATSDGTATAPADYAATQGTLTFRHGERAKTISIAVVADAVIEEDETFGVSLASPVNAVLADGTATGAITNDDVVAAVTPGAYAGATQDGNYVKFTVLSDRTLTGFSVNRSSFDCVPRVSLEQQLVGQMSIISNYWFREFAVAIGDDASFDGRFTRSSARLPDIDSLTATARVTGRFGTPATVAGSVLITLDLTYKGTHLACSSGQLLWTASLQGSR